MSRNRNENFLWAGTVRTKSFQERFKAAQVGGFTEMSVFPIDIKVWENEGKTIEELKLLASNFEVRITVLDPFTKWLPKWGIPSYMSRSDAAFVDFGEDEFFRIAEELEVGSITIIETFGTEYTFAELTQNAARIADRAKGYGLRVHIEFMPFSGIPDLETAWRIVQHLDRDNLGLVFDTWHYYRGNINDGLLKTLPGEKIFHVQLADATKEPTGKDIFDDLMHHRLFPGEGEFPLKDNYKTLKGIGATHSVGIELFSDEVDQMTAVEIGTCCRKAINDLNN